MDTLNETTKKTADLLINSGLSAREGMNVCLTIVEQILKEHDIETKREAWEGVNATMRNNLGLNEPDAEVQAFFDKKEAKQK
jgi:hypothetical protein